MPLITPSSRLDSLSEYYFSRKLKEIQTLREAGHDVINLGIGSPDLSPDQSVVHSLNEMALRPESHGYQPYHGNAFLREAIGKHMLSTYSVLLDPVFEILPLMGSKEGILHISMAFANSGDTVLVPELGYPAYRSISLMLGLKVVSYPLTSDYQPDLSNFTEDMAKASILWANYPHMPTGTPGSEKTFDHLVDYCRKNQILLVNDNPYSLVMNAHPISVLSRPHARDIALELNSLSKSHNMAGWRIGWVAGHQDLVQPVLKVKSNIDSGMFKGLEWAAVTALALDEEWHQKRNAVYSGRQEEAFGLLQDMGCTFISPQVGLFVWGKLPEGNDAEAFSQQVLDSTKVFVTPGSLFGEKGKEYIRISLCSPKERIREARLRFGEK